MAGAKGRGRGESESSPRRVTAKEKQAIALRLRMSGCTYQQIADEVGYKTPGAARDAIESAMKATIQEPAEEYRNMHRARLESVLRFFWPGLMAGDWKAGEVCLSAMQQIAKLDGLDAPKRVRFEDDMEAQVRAMARAAGTDEDEAVARAKEVVKQLDKA